MVYPYETQEHFTGESFRAFPLIGILRGFETDVALAAAETAADAGLSAIEVTMNTSDVFEQIRALRRRLPESVHVGVGTVIHAVDVRRAIEAGAGFIVSPTTNPAVMAVAIERGVPVFPGAMTPTEILAAHEGGATMVKLFPAGALGAAYLKAVKGPLDQVRLLPTGGVGLNNIADFAAAGADGFGVGSPLFARDKLQERDWKWLRDQVRQFRECIDQARTEQR